MADLGRAPARGSKKVIVTGDDFGLAAAVNEAVVLAHAGGILTSASLMTGAGHCADAVEKARRHPTLRVGLHLTLVEGRPVSPPGEVPDLVDAGGEFSTRLVRSGFRFFFLPGVRRQLEREIRAQFEAFARTGLALDHADAHNHMHLHPTVLGLMLDVGREYGLPAVRLPKEPPVRSWRAAGGSLAPRLASAAFLAPWTFLMKRRLGQAGVKCNDHLFGMSTSGAMTEGTLQRILRNLPDGVTELCCHPATRRSPETDRTMPAYRHEEEFQALTGDALRRTLREVGADAVAFGDL
ncbi:MAG: hopanoid biosynthesis-associated protein HpnK [Acidobacteriota bacterium]|jgi:hopanoid biosynthesis associated protein HpnK|nr:hopanoid biosynthesis-associated protein HpnK [Acidobacteriota bacterium]